MNAQQFQHLRDLFHRACDLPPAEQPGFVTEACGDDGEVRAQLEKLLGLDAASSHALVDSAAPLGARLLAGAAHAAVPPLTQVGRYRILRPIGEGGMGAVFLAEQDNPRRAVALKMLRPGLYSADLLRRFQHEAHILGRLQHPGIAQVFEAGAAELPGGASQLFFAMEFIDGQPLTDFARSRRMSVHERLDLIARTCDAVQHAHQRGVIHRDLKPANILVVEEGVKGSRGQPEGRYDTAASSSAPRTLAPSAASPPQPKVLDFGVARVMDDDAQHTMHTATGQIVGTLAYMSPEQLAGDPLAVDTRTDVYALGVVLYELLAGRLPFVTEGRSIHEVIDAIRAQEPPRLAALQPALAGDVETIVHKALEKDPTRRYASAAELAADLRRFLRDEPIAARPPTLLYQLRKFAQRNTALVTGVALAVAALVLGTIGTSWQAWRATHERQRAEAALVDAQRARGVAEATTEFLNHDVLSAASLEAPGPARDVRISDIVARVEERVAAGALRDKPEVEASIRNTLGYMNRQIGRLDAAEEHHRAALEKHRQLYGDEHATVAVTLGNLGELVAERGRPDEAEPLLRRALGMSRRLIGPTARETGVAAMNLSGLLAERRDLAGAEALVAEALSIFQSAGSGAGAEVILALNNLANLKRDARDLDGAEQLYRQALALARRDLGDDHLTVALLLNNLGLALKFRRDFDGAEPLYREALEIRRKRLPPGHQALGESLNNLAALMRDKTDFAAAEPLFREALAIAEQTFPAGSWQIEVTRRSVGTCELKLGRFAEAEKTLKTAYKRLALLPEPLADHARRTAALLAELYEQWGAAEADSDRSDEVARWKERAAPPAP